jgi:hypothetical protein
MADNPEVGTTQKVTQKLAISFERSAQDLIAELEKEAKNHWIVVIAIDFKTSITFVRAEDENGLAMLNSAIRAGGSPVGLITADKSGCDVAMSMQAYPEHWNSKEFDGEGHPHPSDARRYLLALIDQIRPASSRVFSSQSRGIKLPN